MLSIADDALTELIYIRKTVDSGQQGQSFYCSKNK